MGLRQRLGNWLTGQKGISADLQSWVQGMDIPDTDQGAKMTSPYMQSAWIYIAVSVLAENLAQIPFRISRVRSRATARKVRALAGASEARGREFCRRALWEDIVEEGPVVDLFERPHSSMSKTLFWEQVVSWDALRGEFFIVPLDANDNPVDLSERNPRVCGMLTLDTGMFWHMVVGFKLEGWRYTGSPLLSPLPSEILLASEVVHSRSMNPYLYWRGMSPLLVAMLPASADYAAEMFQKGLLMNNADTGIIATTDQALTPEQREQFTAALRERKRKAGTPDRPLFLSSGVKIEKPTISNVDMQFLETRRLLRQEIGAIFKVPETLMGFSDSKAGSLSGGGQAMSVEQHSFVEQTLAARCHRIESAVAPIIATFGDDLVGWFDIEGLPVMQEARRARLDSAGKAFAMGVPFNMINRVYDLGFENLAWGDRGYLAFNLQPADAEQEMPGEDDDGTEEAEGAEGAETKPDDNPRSDGKEGREDGTPLEAGLRLMGEIRNPKPEGRRKAEIRNPNTAALWQRHVRARAGMVKTIKAKVGRVLNEFRAKTLAKLDVVHLEKAESTKQKAEIEQRGLVDLIFSAGEFGNALRLVVEHPIRAALQQAGEEARREVGETGPWAMPPKQVAEFLSGRSQPIMGVGGVVRDQLNTSLEAGYDAGETTAELAARVKGVFNNLTDAEAVRVARTETNLAFNAARHEALGDAGIEYKAWLSSHGPRVRAGHAAAEAAYIDNPIPIDQAFVVDLDGEGEQMMYPGDDSLGASPGNIINCQCVQLAAMKESEDEESETFRVFGLGTMKFSREKAQETQKGKHCCGHEA